MNEIFKRIRKKNKNEEKEKNIEDIKGKMTFGNPLFQTPQRQLKLKLENL